MLTEVIVFPIPDLRQLGTDLEVIEPDLTDEHLRLPLSDPTETGIGIVGIDGITPGSAELSIPEAALADGGSFFYTRVPSRTITLSLVFDWWADIERVRQTLYKWFPLQGSVGLWFVTTHKTRQILGIIEEVSVDIFQERESATVTIRCPDPYFTDPGEDGMIDINLQSWISEFEFTWPLMDPISEFGWGNNDKDRNTYSLTAPLIEFGTMLPQNYYQFEYPGDVSAGMIFSLTMNDEFGSTPKPSSIRVENVTYNEIFTLVLQDLNSVTSPIDYWKEYTGSELTKGDFIVVSTEPGRRDINLVVRNDIANNHNGIGLLRPNNEYDITSSWPMVHPGVNEFSFNFTGVDGVEYTNNAISLSMIYYPRYLGV